MSNSGKGKRNLVIGIVAIFIMIVFGLFMYLSINGFIGMSPLAISLLFGSILFAFIFTASICAWVYKDSVSRGGNGILWILIVIFTNVFIGLIIYLICRKDVKETCQSCHRQIDKRANYCEYCGARNEAQEEGTTTKTDNGFIKYLITSIVAIVLMVGCLFSFTVLAFTMDDFVDEATINVESSVIIYQTSFGNKWKLNLMSASYGNRLSDTLKVEDNSQILYADIECGEGELLLHIEQDDKRTTIDVSNLEEPLKYSLEDFQAGKITVTLEVNGARNVKSFITVK